ncbi:DUF5953 family protein [Myxococcus hansupus]|uniref:DUF5953 family protein n=1 Tax=Pseudomyxococcus hansupus TaxID=1297742 RepID=UPI001D0514B4
MGGDGRVLAVVQRMERALPGLWLDWSVGEGQRLAALPRLVAASRGKEVPFLCSGDERHPVMISGFISSGQPLSEVHSNLPLDVEGIAASADSHSVPHRMLEPPDWRLRRHQRVNAGE